MIPQTKSHIVSSEHEAYIVAQINVDSPSSKIKQQSHMRGNLSNSCGLPKDIVDFLFYFFLFSHIAYGPKETRFDDG